MTYSLPLLLSQKKDIIVSHNLFRRDPKLTSPVPKNHLVQSQKSSCPDRKSTPPVPKSDLSMSHISPLHDLISFPPVPKVTLTCSIFHLVETHYQLLLSQQVTLFLSHSLSHYDPISTSPVPKNHLAMLHHTSGYDLILSSTDPSS